MDCPFLKDLRGFSFTYNKQRLRLIIHWGYKFMDKEYPQDPQKLSHHCYKL